MPSTRKGDPSTSHEAEASVTRVTKKQTDILACFRMFGPMTDGDLIAVYPRYAQGEGWDHQSESGLRTRRREITDKKLLKAVGKTVNDGGRKVIVWGTTDERYQSEQQQLDV
jgi:hypothetical protein